MSKRWFLIGMTVLVVVGSGLTSGVHGVGVAMIVLAIVGFIFAPEELTRLEAVAFHDIIDPAKVQEMIDTIRQQQATSARLGQLVEKWRATYEAARCACADELDAILQGGEMEKR